MKKVISVHNIERKFQKMYGAYPLFIAKSPGRAEIIGNHTDYNLGFAIGAAINLDTIAAVSPRNDDLISAYSENLDKVPTLFQLKDLRKRKYHHWTNYVKAVVGELTKKKEFKNGFNLYIFSTVPSSGGVSSSAALELSLGLALSKLYKIKISLLRLAVLCQKAENSPLINSPCGFLDQATSALSKENNLLFLDFLPKKGVPVSKFEYIPIDLSKFNLSFLIVVDKKIKRNLGESGYPERRKTCEKSLPILSKLLKKKIKSLRGVSVVEFDKYQKDLEKADKKMRKRVEHIVYENQRVLDAVGALKKKDIKLFGKLLTLSGKSALELYELDEKTPELTFLLQQTQNMEGVLGARNMGGGFSANILVLIKNTHLKKFVKELSAIYRKRYSSNPEFIQFQPAGGTKIYAPSNLTGL